MGSAPVKRIEDVRVLRSAQFPEDSGPLAHPIRPDSYQEISNFYTATVYNKGAEVIRMMRTMAGPARFRAGTDLYFRAARWRGCDLRGFRHRDRGRRGARPQALPPLVRAGGHPAGQRRARACRATPRRCAFASGAGDPRPARQAADADPAAHRAVRPRDRRQRRRAAAGARGPASRPFRSPASRRRRCSRSIADSRRRSR